ncbi:DUF2306 domain-containing protein [Roseiconus nitratireducens]|nr:DUF2306 domain-containing protein [Roseiconus nitratireducens]
MRPFRWLTWRDGVLAGVGCAVAYLAWLIVTPYPRYLVPDFQEGFLSNKQEFFFSSGYFLGFYSHIFAAPVALLCGVLQFLPGLRRRFPGMHRRLGQLYAALVLLWVAPGGLVMSTRAYGGWSSVICFALISLLTWASTFSGWRAAGRGCWKEHGRWMARSYVLMTSALFLRLIHMVLIRTPLGHETAYQCSAWLSWLLPLAILECCLTLGAGQHSAGNKVGRTTPVYITEK